LLDTIVSLGLSPALGLLIGLERGWHERGAAEGSRVAGIRTFGLIGLLGGLWQLLALAMGPVVLGLAFGAFVLLITIAHVAESRVSGDYGITTLVAGSITFALGALAVRGEHTVAAAGAVVTTIVLNLKPVLHDWLKRIEASELTAALKLLLISVVILPVLPNQGYGPWSALNPYELWWLVVLIATISFAAYCAVKIVGADRGILWTGFLGGLVSSTAVSIHLARLGKSLDHPDILAAGVLVASATMFVRVLLLTALLGPGLAWPLSAPLLSMAGVLFGSAFVYSRRSKTTAIEAVRLRNPVELTAAFRFTALLAVVLVASKAMQVWLGEKGIYFLAALAGLSDVDAITISMARLSASEIPPRLAVQAIIVASLVNSVTKAMLVRVIGPRALANKVFLPIALCALIGAAAIRLIALW